MSSESKALVSPEEYLHFEMLTEIKHQLIDGKIYAMPDITANHNLIMGNIAFELKNRLKGTYCDTFISKLKLRVINDFFYPDVMVVCCNDNEDEYYKTAPSIIVEVLSKPTRKLDQTIKRLRCQAIPSLEEYLLVEQDKAEIEVFSRRHLWQAAYYYLGDEIRFESLGITLTVDDIYDDINIEDVISYQQQIMPSSPANG